MFKELYLTGTEKEKDKKKTTPKTHTNADSNNNGTRNTEHHQMRQSDNSVVDYTVSCSWFALNKKKKIR